nr:hypothetical protein CFP56_12443 [Quercus suber]
MCASRWFENVKWKFKAHDFTLQNVSVCASGQLICLKARQKVNLYAMNNITREIWSAPRKTIVALGN